MCRSIAAMGLSCVPSASAAGDDDHKEAKKVNKQIEEQLQKDKTVFRATHRLLLLGW
jgi:guanine nucleotide-binding protein G(s) subunit alpha